jgi:hypothetical protein
LRVPDRSPIIEAAQDRQWERPSKAVALGFKQGDDQLRLCAALRRTPLPGALVAAQIRLGKFLQVKGPGLFLIVPLIDQLRRIDTYVQTIQIARYAVLFFKVPSASNTAVLAVPVEMMEIIGGIKDVLRTRPS